MRLFSEFYPFYHLFISVSIGLLVGLQREWAESPLGGIRTFSLMSLLGTLLAILAVDHGSWIIGVGLLCVMVATVTARLLEKSKSEKLKSGLVTEISILIMYSLGVLTLKEPLLAASIACIMAALLHIKLELHALASKFDKNEIRSVMQFLVISLVIFPILPNKSFGPDGALNLHNIGLMVILIVGISLFGYIIYKFRDKDSGILWGGILGGIISSTATTLSYARSSKESHSPVYNSLIILVAWGTLYIRVFLELYVVAPEFNVTLPLLIMSLVSILTIFWTWRRTQHELTSSKIEYNPTDLKTALFFAVWYAVIIYAFTYLKSYFGNAGLSAMAFISGIMDVDAITLSTGRLVHTGVITKDEGNQHFFLAILANLSFKGILAYIIGGLQMFRVIFLPWIISILCAIAILLQAYIN